VTNVGEVHISGGPAVPPNPMGGAQVFPSFWGPATYTHADDVK